MSARLSITELPDGEILIDGQPTDFCPPWKTEDAIRQQARDIAELRAELQMCCELKREYQERAAVAAEQADQLRTDLAAAVSENAALLAANRDLKAHFDALKGDYDEAAHFARHFIRDDAAITPRGAIIRLGDKCTDLFVRLQQAEARLAAIDAQPTVVTVGHGDYLHRHTANVPIGTELIARPAKD